MTNNLIKIVLTALATILMSRVYIDWIKANKAKKSGMVKILFSIIFIFFFVYIELFQTTMFEFLLGFLITLLLFASRKRIRKIFSSKLGKVKAVGAILLFPVGIWLALALFYQTPLGKPIGVKNYLYHKYDEEFETSSTWAENYWGKPVNGFICWPKNGIKETDVFRVEKKRTLSAGSMLFASDNYYGIIIRKDYENSIAEVIDNYFEEFKIFARFEYSGISNIVYMSDHLSKDTTLEEFIEYQSDKNTRSSHDSASVDVFIPEELIADKESTIKKIDMIAKELEHKYPYLTVSFITMSDDSVLDYESLNRYTFLNRQYRPVVGVRPRQSYSAWRHAYLIYNYEAELTYEEINENFWNES